MAAFVLFILKYLEFSWIINNPCLCVEAWGIGRISRLQSFKVLSPDNAIKVCYFPFFFFFKFVDKILCAKCKGIGVFLDF